jgi:anti-sigma-K factor RskA
MNETPENREGCGIDVAAYALGALDPGEATAFATHLETCKVCREELTEFEAVVATLPMTAPAHRAPAGLRRRVLDAVAEDARGPQPAARRAAGRRRLVWPALPRPRLALGGALAVIIVAVVVGVSLSGGGAASRVYAAQVTGSAGTAKLTVTDGHAELIVNHMPAPPAGKIYEVWLARADGVHPTTALFSVTRNGSGDVAVPGNLHGVSAVMVTPEPAGGSRVPTHAPVIRAQLT